MAKTRVFKHLGYFNTKEDIRNLALKSADEIRYYYTHGYGNFTNDTNPEEDTNLHECEELDNIKKNEVRITKDRNFAVRDSSFVGWGKRYENLPDYESTDVFIDLYQLIGEEESNVEDNSEKYTYEECPHCGEVVKLDAELKVQVCPVCGKHIVSCSCCRALYDNVNDCCKHCALSYQADYLNSDDEEIDGLLKSVTDKIAESDKMIADAEKTLCEYIKKKFNGRVDFNDETTYPDYRDDTMDYNDPVLAVKVDDNNNLLFNTSTIYGKVDEDAWFNPHKYGTFDLGNLANCVGNA